jgi:dolichyl-phosphate beta-glucosyltransferase
MCSRIASRLAFLSRVFPHGCWPELPSDQAEHVAWIVPCFDEAARIDGPAFLALLDESAPASLIFVDDGSRDQTLRSCALSPAQRPAQAEVIALPTNQGKAEAVRQGLLRALARGAKIVRLRRRRSGNPTQRTVPAGRPLSATGGYDILMGSRVQLLGRAIERSHMPPLSRPRLRDLRQP